MDELISRQAAIEIIHTLYPSAPIMRMNRKRWEGKYKPYIECEKALEWLPSVHPERKKGHWIEAFDFHGANYICSNCGQETHTAITYDLEGNTYRYNYCPHCGANMKGENDG